jgi:ferritin-like metal-binding protein YciE
MTTTKEIHNQHVKDFYIWENVTERYLNITTSLSTDLQKNVVQHRLKEGKTLIQHYEDSFPTWKNDVPSEKCHKAERLSKQLHAVVERIVEASKGTK